MNDNPYFAGGDDNGDEIGDRAWNIVNHLAQATLGGELRGGGRPGSRRAQSLQVGYTSHAHIVLT